MNVDGHKTRKFATISILVLITLLVSFSGCLDLGERYGNADSIRDEAVQKIESEQYSFIINFSLIRNSSETLSKKRFEGQGVIDPDEKRKLPVYSFVDYIVVKNDSKNITSYETRSKRPRNTDLIWMDNESYKIDESFHEEVVHLLENNTVELMETTDPIGWRNKYILDVNASGGDTAYYLNSLIRSVTGKPPFNVSEARLKNADVNMEVFIRNDNSNVAIVNVMISKKAKNYTLYSKTWFALDTLDH